MNKPRCRVSLLFFFALICVYIIKNPNVILAQIPPGTISCDQVDDPEFHSLRPYQANTKCTSQTANMATFCGNELTIKETITQTYPGGGGTCASTGGKIKCTYDVAVPSHLITIDLSGANLPIMGNTEDVRNSQNSSDTLTDTDKTNEYVSWYLNGVINRAEYGESKNTDYNAVNFSGPLQKLLPGAILEGQRTKSINSAKNNTNHNQIVACVKSNVPIIGDLLGIGPFTPTECYEGNGGKAQGQVFRLNRQSGSHGWDGDISLIRTITNFVPGGMQFVLKTFTKLLPPSIIKYVAQDVIENSISAAWNKATPPLPWDDGTGKPFESGVLYRKAYNEWHGKTCVVIPIINYLICLDNFLITNQYADLFPYVPLSSTEDVPGYISVDSVSSATSPTVGGTTIKDVKFSNQTPSELFFSHMQESSQLGSLLQDTYTPQGQDKVGGPTNVSSDISCNDVEVRSNKGDDLFATQLTGNLSYNASFTCEFDPVSSSFSSPVCSSIGGARCVPGDWSCSSTYGSIDCGSGYTCGVGCSSPTQTCKKDVYIRLSTQSSIPMADDIWSRLVAGPMAVFKRIFPKTNTEGSVGQIMDIPGSTSITFSGSNVSQSSTDLKIPHIGGVSEYFLKGIQTALRPKGFGEPISFANPSTANVPAGECDGTVFSKYNPSSQTTGTANSYFNSYILPKLTNDLVSVYKEAERQTGVPCEVLAGVHFEEGSSDPNKSLQNGGSLNGKSLLDSAIQAGHEIAAKVGGSINSRDDLITALSYYNGGGNSNCGKSSEYKGPCPPPSGIDDPYVTSFIDAGHLTMKLIYCWDFTQCPLPYPDFQRPGVLTVATELYNSK